MTCDLAFGSTYQTFPPVLSKEGSGERSIHMMWYVGKTSVYKAREHLAVQILFSILSKLKQLPLSSSQLVLCVLSRLVVKKVQGKSSQMRPHLDNSWMYLVPGHKERDSQCYFKACVQLFK